MPDQPTDHTYHFLENPTKSERLLNQNEENVMGTCGDWSTKLEQLSRLSIAEHERLDCMIFLRDELFPRERQIRVLGPDEEEHPEDYEDEQLYYWGKPKSNHTLFKEITRFIKNMGADLGIRSYP
jgi:hypothetical protein